MAATNTTLTSGQRGAHGIALSASTVDTVTFPTYVGQVEVTNMDGLSPIYFTVDGSTPTVGGAATFMLPATVSSRVVRVPQVRSTSSQALAVSAVKLISAGTPTYSVQEA